MNKTTQTALIDAALTSLYIAGVGTFMNFASKLKIGDDDSFFGPIAFLSVFVLSAAVTSSLMFGKPALWYLDGKKKEALSLGMQTIGFFFVITVVIFTVLVISTR